MGHQDVVPVNPDTIDEWTFPPYSGHFDGRLLWGRGASDDKNDLIGFLTTIELLIENGFKPSRTIVLSFGFDEEASELEGAGHLGKHLLDKYGEDSFAMLIDEGGKFHRVKYITICVKVHRRLHDRAWKGIRNPRHNRERVP